MHSKIFDFQFFNKGCALIFCIIIRIIYFNLMLLKIFVNNELFFNLGSYPRKNEKPPREKVENYLT